MKKRVFKILGLILIIGLASCQKETIEQKATGKNETVTERGSFDPIGETRIFVTEAPGSKLCRVQRDNSVPPIYDPSKYIEITVEGLTQAGALVQINNLTGIDAWGIDQFLVTTGVAGNHPDFQNRLLIVEVDWSSQTATAISTLVSFGSTVTDISFLDTYFFGNGIGLMGLEQGTNSLVWTELNGGFLTPRVIPMSQITAGFSAGGLAWYYESCTGQWQLIVTCTDASGMLEVYSVDPNTGIANPVSMWPPSTPSPDFMNTQVAIQWDGRELTYGHLFYGNPNQFAFTEEGADCNLTPTFNLGLPDFEIPPGVNAIEDFAWRY